MNLLKVYVFACACVWVCTHVWGAHGGQKRVLHPLELELKTVVSHLRWGLGTEPWSAVNAVCYLNHRAIFKFTEFSIYIFCSLLSLNCSNSSLSEIYLNI